MLEETDTSETLDDGFSASELAGLLDALPSDGWVVERTLSTSQFETTQLVSRDKGVVNNKFIRKVFPRGTSLGAAYKHVFSAQAAGTVFSYLPIVYDMAETDEGVAVIIQLVQGETLQRFVEAGNRGVEVATFIGRQLCDAMDELHGSFEDPIVHRDLKPGNIMIADGKLMLIDLGIARSWHAGATHDTVRLGTPGYAPPEQYGYGQTTPQSDIYAAGMVLAFCLTGRNPTNELREKGFVDPRIPEEFRPVLQKATALDAAHRFESASAMKAAIDEAIYRYHKTQASRPSKHNESSVVQNRQDMAGEASGIAAASKDAANTATTRKRDSVISDGVGIAWNTVLLIAWGFFTFISIYTALSGGTDFLDSQPVWARLIEYFGIVVAPVTAIAILLLDKRRLKNRFPVLGRYTWLRMLIACIAFIVVDYLVIIVLYGIFLVPNM